LPTQCSPNTKHQTPVTNLHTPGKQNNGGEKEKYPNDDLETRQKIANVFAVHGVNIAPRDEKIGEIAKLMATEEEIHEAITQAKEMRKKASSSTPINPGLVLAILKGMRKKIQGQESSEDAWWKTNEGIDAKGRELDMRAQGSESYESFKARILIELRKRKEMANAG
jgi:hypothetical protein